MCARDAEKMCTNLEVMEIKSIDLSVLQMFKQKSETKAEPYECWY